MHAICQCYQHVVLCQAGCDGAVVGSSRSREASSCCGQALSQKQSAASPPHSGHSSDLASRLGGHHLCLPHSKCRWRWDCSGGLQAITMLCLKLLLSARVIAVRLIFMAHNTNMTWVFELILVCLQERLPLQRHAIRLLLRRRIAQYWLHHDWAAFGQGVHAYMHIVHTCMHAAYMHAAGAEAAHVLGRAEWQESWECLYRSIILGTAMCGAAPLSGQSTRTLPGPSTATLCLCQTPLIWTSVRCALTLIRPSQCPTAADGSLRCMSQAWSMPANDAPRLACMHQELTVIFMGTLLQALPLTLAHMADISAVDGFCRWQQGLDMQ